MGKYRSYPSNAGMTNQPAHHQPIVAVDMDWVMRYGSRAQRRRIERELRQTSKPKKPARRRDGK